MRETAQLGCSGLTIVSMNLPALLLTALSFLISGGEGRGDAPEAEQRPPAIEREVQARPEKGSERPTKGGELEKTELLQSGDCGRDVVALREQLAALRYLPRDMSAGECFDEAAFFAVMALQKREGLTRDGVAGPETLAALARAKAPKPELGLSNGIEVLLERQLALLVKDGRVVQAVAISSGAPGYDTPAGSFSVYRKEQMSWSVPFESWLPWASYFTGGIAFHEYADVPAYAASHGCIRVPAPFAKRVYQFADMGLPVLVG